MAERVTFPRTGIGFYAKNRKNAKTPTRVPIKAPFSRDRKNTPFSPARNLQCFPEKPPNLSPSPYLWTCNILKQVPKIRVFFGFSGNYVRKNDTFSRKSSKTAKRRIFPVFSGFETFHPFSRKNHSSWVLDAKFPLQNPATAVFSRPKPAKPPKQGWTHFRNSHRTCRSNPRIPGVQPYPYGTGFGAKNRKKTPKSQNPSKTRKKGI